MGQFGIGQSVSRLEDPRLLTGRGRYLDDINLDNQARGFVLRSPYAHANICRIDATEAKQAPGVLAIFTGDDFAASGLGSQTPQVPRTKADGSPGFVAPQPALVKTAKFVGDYIAFVVAETLDQAKDAAELIDIDFESLPSAMDTATAADPDTPAVWEDCPDNICFVHDAGDRAATDAAFERADHIISQDIDINRITANSMEARGSIGSYDKDEERYVLHVGTQGPHALRGALAKEIFKVDIDRVHIIADDMGGGFGMKGGLYPEYTLCLWAAKEIGRPVKWVSDRSEAILSDTKARDNITKAKLALDKDGKFIGLRVRTIANIGAYYAADRIAVSGIQHIGVLSGPYTTGAVHIEITLVLTNTVNMAPYRGAGRPEAAYVMERLVDLASKELGLSPTELRRRNYIAEDAFPYKTSFLYTYDSGEFEKNMDMAIADADYENFEERRQEAANRGKLLGIGLSNTIELAQGGPTETATTRFDASGKLTLITGTKNSGQGHETMYKQMVHSMLGLDTDDVTFIDGDTDQIDSGNGTFGSRSAFMGGSAINQAAEKIIEKAKKIASHVLEAAESDIEFSNGKFVIAGTDRTLSMTDVAKASFDPDQLPPGMEPGLEATETYKTDYPTFPNGCHICEVEIDPDTGKLKIMRYTVIDDVGRVVNPLTLKGQIHGGIAQGLGQVLMEDLSYDSESGQILAGSFMDYAMPRADDFCHFAVKANEVITPTNPLGAKGGGEAGTVGSVAAGMNAIANALEPLGIKHVDLPCTAEKLWRIIQEAKAV